MPEQPQHPNELIPSPEEQERIKLHICHFFEEKLATLENTAGESALGYVQQFYELCTGIKQPWTRQKEFNLPGLPMPIRIRFDRHSHYVPADRRLDININPLLEAKDTSTLKQAMLLILEDVYHEAEHIFLAGFPIQYGMELEDRQQAVQYLCHPGEINAFARQYAFRYSQAYPEEIFDDAKMRILAIRLREEKPKQADAYNYFIAFADPEIQRRNKKWGNLATAHASIITETKGHLEKLKQTT